VNQIVDSSINLLADTIENHQPSPHSILQNIKLTVTSRQGKPILTLLCVFTSLLPLPCI